MTAPPPLNEEDRQAILAILTRYQRIWMRRGIDRALVEAAEKRIAEADIDIARLQGAFAAFGFEIDKDGFKEMQEAFGNDYWRALERGGWVRPPLPTAAPTTNDIEPDAEPVPYIESAATVRDLVLDCLNAAGDKGIKAADTRAHVETVRQTKLHEKTIGMTLYRLSQDGLVRREGRTWFYVPPSQAETKNPGGDTPGSNDGLEDLL